MKKAIKITAITLLSIVLALIVAAVCYVVYVAVQYYRIDGNTTKVALRGAAIKQIPERTANKKKLGFPVPLNDWLRQDKYYSMVLEKFEGEIADRFFNREAILKLLNDHKSGVALNMKKIWTIYSFILWYEEFFILH